MKKVISWFNRKLFKKIDASGLAAFRVFYSIVLLCEVFQLYRFREIVYSKTAWPAIGELNVEFIFIFWVPVILLMLFGLFTRVATIVNYVFSVFVFSSLVSFEYHVVYTYVGIGFLLMFMPVSRVFSIDALINKLTVQRSSAYWNSYREVVAANYIVPVFVGIGLVYFDSVFYKMAGPMWQKGLGLWLPASLPMATWNDTSFLLNKVWIVKGLSWSVIVFELLLVFLVWFKIFRVPSLLMGIFFHVGILIDFPIPWFALAVIAVYILMVPVGWWLALGRALSLAQSTYTIYYNSDYNSCNKLAILIKCFDVFNAVHCKAFNDNANELPLNLTKANHWVIGIDHNGNIHTGLDAFSILFGKMLYLYPFKVITRLPGLSKFFRVVYKYSTALLGKRRNEFDLPSLKAQQTYNTKVTLTTKIFWSSFLVFSILAQICITWFAPLVQQGVLRFRTHRILNEVMAIPNKAISEPLKHFWGITFHPVFVDAHFEGYNHIVMVRFFTNRGELVQVPMLDERGMPDKWARGVLWRNILFNVITPTLNKKVLEENVKPYLNYFLRESAIGTNGGKFIFYIKEVYVPKVWEYNHLKNQIAKPWVEAGICVPQKDSMYFSWNVYAEQVFAKENNCSK